MADRSMPVPMTLSDFERWDVRSLLFFLADLNIYARTVFNPE